MQNLVPGPLILTDSDGHAFEMRPIHCPTCGISPRKELGWRGGSYHRYGWGVPTLLQQCRSCGLIFPDPFPYPVDPQRLYGDPAKYFERHDEDARVQSCRQLVRDLIVRTERTDPSVLDVGSGRGELLSACVREGLTTMTGLELADAMISYARDNYGVEVLAQTIEEHAEKSGGVYDATVLNAVLEHAYDPDSMIAAAAKLTRPGGVLYLDVPNEPNLLATVARLYSRAKRSKAVFNLSPTFPPYHVYGFNLRALDRLLVKHGFRIVESRIWASPEIPSRGRPKDRVLAGLGTQVQRVANWTGTACNMSLWAERSSAGARRS